MPWWGWLLVGMAVVMITAVVITALVAAEGRDWAGEDPLPDDLGDQPNLPNELHWPKEPYRDSQGRERDVEPRGA